jgi:hypothetical protein
MVQRLKITAIKPYPVWVGIRNQLTECRRLGVTIEFGVEASHKRTAFREPKRGLRAAPGFGKNPRPHVPCTSVMRSWCRTSDMVATLIGRLRLPW